MDLIYFKKEEHGMNEPQVTIIERNKGSLLSLFVISANSYSFWRIITSLFTLVINWTELVVVVVVVEQDKGTLTVWKWIAWGSVCQKMDFPTIYAERDVTISNHEWNSKTNYNDGNWPNLADKPLFLSHLYGNFFPLWLWSVWDIVNGNFLDENIINYMRRWEGNESHS